MASGYTSCACRDCMDIALGNEPVLCWECEEAVCEIYRPNHQDYVALPGYMQECQREDAYEGAM